MSSKKFSDDEIIIRQAKKEDMAAVVEMIQELADFEKMPDGPKLSVKDLERDGFGTTHPLFLCKVAALAAPQDDPSVVGYALYFPTYSTWEGRSMMLEDLYVRPAVRGRGAGKMLFQAVAKDASAFGSSRLDFHVLEWNNARSFYESQGAVNLTSAESWCYYRLSGDALKTVAGNVQTKNTG